MGIWTSITSRGRSVADAASRLGSFEVSREIEAPADSVWDILVDTETWPEWGPFVVDVEHGTRRISAQSEGRVRTAAGVWLSFRVTGGEPGAYWVWSVEGVRATGHRVESLESDRCRLVFEVPVVAAPYAAVCRRAARTIDGMAVRP